MSFQEMNDRIEPDSGCKFAPSFFWKNQKVKLKTKNHEEFETTDKLLEGIYGCIYKGYHTKTRQECLIRKVKSSEEALMEKDIKIMKYLKKVPIVIRYLGNYQNPDTGINFVVTEYMKNTGLNGLSTDQIKFIMKELLVGLEFCHRRGVMHRHLSPHSIWFDKIINKLLIIDWGNAELTLSIASFPTNVGEKFYRAPELVLGVSSYDCAVDMWAVGCIFAEMLTGKTPFFHNSYDTELYSMGMAVGAKELLRTMRKLRIPVPEHVHYRMAPYCNRTIETYLRDDCKVNLKKEEILFLKMFLQVNWKRRITAITAQDHYYFYSHRLVTMDDINGNDSI